MILYYFIVGSVITPNEWATLSPNDLDIAKPGDDNIGDHTLAGPTDSPLKSLKCSTFPPLLLILIRSFGSSALWSYESSMTLILLSKIKKIYLYFHYSLQQWSYYLQHEHSI